MSACSSSIGHHDFACAVLSSARGILDAGLEKLIRNIAIHQLCNVCSEIIYLQSDNVIRSVQSLRLRYREKEKKDNRSLVNSEVKNCTLSFSHVLYDDIYGRQLFSSSSSEGISRGCSVLKEAPWVVTVKKECHCREEMLLSEHISLAYSIFDFYFSGTENKSKSDGNYDRLLLFLAFLSPERFQ